MKIHAIAVRCPRDGTKMAEHVEGQVWHTCSKCKQVFMTEHRTAFSKKKVDTPQKVV